LFCSDLCLLLLADVDFEGEIYRTTFKPGQTRSSVCIVIIDDDIREGDEKFRLILAIPKTTQKKLDVWAGTPFYADVKIIGIVILLTLLYRLRVYILVIHR